MAGTFLAGTRGVARSDPNVAFARPPFLWFAIRPGRSFRCRGWIKGRRLARSSGEPWRAQASGGDPELNPPRPWAASFPSRAKKRRAKAFSINPSTWKGTPRGRGRPSRPAGSARAERSSFEKFFRPRRSWGAAWGPRLWPQLQGPPRATTSSYLCANSLRPFGAQDGPPFKFQTPAYDQIIQGLCGGDGAVPPAGRGNSGPPLGGSAKPGLPIRLGGNDPPGLSPSAGGPRPSVRREGAPGGTASSSTCPCWKGLGWWAMGWAGFFETGSSPGVKAANLWGNEKHGPPKPVGYVSAPAERGS